MYFYTVTSDEMYMKQCLQLAEKGRGHTAPNPLVGCVVVHQGKVIGEGFHERLGGPHAEVNAIRSVIRKELLKDSTLYVNLEPCCHMGKTPPCCDLIIEHKIPRVVIGTIDPNPLVNWKGAERLAAGGCHVVTGVLEKECQALNIRFFTYFEKKRPYIILKWAQSADGFIDAERSSPSQGPAQISNAESKKLLHKWRSEEQAILVGTNTALLDNPMLTVREWEGRNPLRLVTDKWLRIPKHYHLLDKSTPTVVYTGSSTESTVNLEYVRINFDAGIVNHILTDLYTRGIQSLMVEGGEKLLTRFIEQNLWDEARVFVSHKKLGKGVAAPVLMAAPASTENIAGDRLLRFTRVES